MAESKAERGRWDRVQSWVMSALIMGFTAVCWQAFNRLDSAVQGLDESVDLLTQQVAAQQHLTGRVDRLEDRIHELETSD